MKSNVVYESLQNEFLRRALRSHVFPQYDLLHVLQVARHRSCPVVQQIQDYKEEREQV